ncbi:hypothetical protein MACH09_06000 [Vibrio sp. MACH09]|uniref:hypothetical protein n=1 Tax=Vibrio sp. MACH09 TaxID=3025122 RepID=UPI0027900017|nr:hypothetical protein [Vibrio sp. MACH09]GLO60092.1 hypothetical protein MACH09_06000 [Vibrio sp. MACH09]
MKNTTKITALLSTFITPFVLAQGSGTLGGNPSSDSGAVNVSVGKCTQYKLDVKTAKQAGKAMSSIEVPKGCKAAEED